MSRHEKLIDKLNRNPPPKDFRFDDLVVLLTRLGFELRQQSGGSSHNYFVREDEGGEEYRIDSSRPHPDGIMKIYQIKEIRQRLTEWGLI